MSFVSNRCARLGSQAYRGRDGCFQPPPAQIRTRSITSYGSYLESNVKAFVWIRVGDAW
jgi:hypothetical protein